MRDLDHAAIETQRIRDLQSRFHVEHAKLANWGLWSGDMRGVYPVMKPPSVWNSFKRSLVEEWGDEPGVESEFGRYTEVKAERVEQKDYDEKAAIALDERMHSPGGLGEEVRVAIRVAYMTKELPEYQMPRHSGCGIDAFLERLEVAYLFARRFS